MPSIAAGLQTRRQLHSWNCWLGWCWLWLCGLHIREWNCCGIVLLWLKSWRLHVSEVDFQPNRLFLLQVRVASDELKNKLRRSIDEFRDLLRSPESSGCGQITLEFFEKKRATMPFMSENIPWEVWTVKLNVVQLANEHGKLPELKNLFFGVFFVFLIASVSFERNSSKHGLFTSTLYFSVAERQIAREQVGELLSEKIMFIAESMNRHEYTPKIPDKKDLDLVFDTEFSDIQPYLHKVIFFVHLVSKQI